jgi:hypothetical protein
MVYIFISVGVLHEAFDNEVNIVEADFVEYHQHCLYHLLYGREMSIWYFEEHIAIFSFLLCVQVLIFKITRVFILNLPSYLNLKIV